MSLDEPLWSPKRIWYAMMLWAWLWRDGTYVSFRRMVRYHRRPEAAERETGH